MKYRIKIHARDDCSNIITNKNINLHTVSPDGNFVENFFLNTYKIDIAIKMVMYLQNFTKNYLKQVEGL